MTAQSVSIYLIICVANVFFFFSIAFNRKCFHDRSPLSFPSTRVLPFHNPEFNYIVQLKCCLWTHCTSSWAVGCWCQTLCLCGQVRRADSAFIRLQSPERQHSAHPCPAESLTHILTHHTLSLSRFLECNQSRNISLLEAERFSLRGCAHVWKEQEERIHFSVSQVFFIYSALLAWQNCTFV